MATATALPSHAPWFGARKLAHLLLAQVKELQTEHDQMRQQFERLGGLTIVQLEARRADLERQRQAASSSWQVRDAQISIDSLRDWTKEPVGTLAWDCRSAAGQIMTAVRGFFRQYGGGSEIGSSLSLLRINNSACGSSIMRNGL
jgi:hypothetical protein